MDWIKCCTMLIDTVEGMIRFVFDIFSLQSVTWLGIPV